MKSHRILEIYNKLLNNQKIDIKKIASEEKKSIRTIERDISEIRDYLLKQNNGNEFIYDRSNKNYSLKNTNEQKFSKSEALAIAKILLDSRAFLKDEMYMLIDKLLKQYTTIEDYKKLIEMIKNEKFHYMELSNKKSFIENLYDYGEVIQNKKKIKIEYRKINGEKVERIVYPVGLMFSEFYFYLLGHIENIDKDEYFQNKDDIFPTIYRVDRIEKLEILSEHFSNIYYSDRFEEGKFRKRIHFMTGGKLRKVRFIYKGSSVEAVLDRIPTARIETKNEDSYLLSAEIFGNGFDKWVKSQGEDVEVISNL